MAKYICGFDGARGRSIKVYDTKIVITTSVTVGSVLTGNATDGTKTIFLKDIVGVQFKKSRALIGYLQFETPSMQMNNKSDNMFSENTFTFTHGVNGITNELMEKLHTYIVDRIEELKYGVPVITNVPNFSLQNSKKNQDSVVKKEASTQSKPVTPVVQPIENTFKVKSSDNKNNPAIGTKVVICPHCKEDLSFMGWDIAELVHEECPLCGGKIVFI